MAADPITRFPLCTVKDCPQPSSPDFHVPWCGHGVAGEHQHVPKRSQGGRTIAAFLCHDCHSHIDNGPTWGNAVVELPAGKTYIAWDGPDAEGKPHIVIERVIGPVGQPAASGDTPYALSWERWLNSLAELALNEREQPWRWGDSVLEGEAAFGEQFSQAFDIDLATKRVFVEVRGQRLDTGLTMSAINKRAWVARCFPAWLGPADDPARLSTRIPEISFSHHRVVLHFEDAEERRHWLMRARDEGWSVARLRQEIGLVKPRVRRWSEKDLLALADQWMVSVGTPEAHNVHDFIRWIAVT